MRWARISAPAPRLACSALCLLGAGVLPASGQDGEPGRLITFGVSQTFYARDNLILAPSSAGTTYASDTRLSFGLDTETDIDSFSLSAESVLRLLDDPLVGREARLSDPRLNVRYERDNGNSQLALFANYSKLDLAFSDPLSQSSLGVADFFRGRGTREEIVGGFRFETGVEAPLGFFVEADSRRLDYSDTTDPLLFENRTDRAQLGFIFRFSPVARATLSFEEERFEAEDIRDTERDTRDITLGLEYDTSPVSVFSLEVGHTEITERLLAPVARSSTSGLVGGVGYTREMPNGELSIDASTILTQLGRQNEFEVGRRLELPTGSLDISLGVAQGDTFDPLPIGRIAYMTEWPRSRFDVALSRDVAISDIVSDATITTRMDAGYEVDLTALSSLSFDVAYADIAVDGPDPAGVSQEQGSVYLTYRRNLTADWDMSLGLEHRFIDEGAPLGRGTSNGVFFSLERDFELLR
ncbi:hypothetical protein FIU86_18050 [Roseovarius sp. THAF9]|nr:hypothetical protein FIU86_18050 [Roseovarius sp. THAF9]